MLSKISKRENEMKLKNEEIEQIQKLLIELLSVKPEKEKEINRLLDRLGEQKR